jgi:hypothetical protein
MRSSRLGSYGDEIDLHPDLTDLLGAFSSLEVEYLVVGGWAVSVHSEPRFTKDLDLLIGLSPENLERAAQALQLFGAPESIVDQARSLGPDEFLFFGTPPARVDLLRSIPGVNFEEAFARRVVIRPPVIGTPLSGSARGGRGTIRRSSRHDRSQRKTLRGARLGGEGPGASLKVPTLDWQGWALSHPSKLVGRDFPEIFVLASPNSGIEVQVGLEPA